MRDDQQPTKARQALKKVSIFIRGMIRVEYRERKRV